MIKVINEFGEIKTFNSINKLLYFITLNDLSVDKYYYIIDCTEYDFKDICNFSNMFFNLLVFLNSGSTISKACMLKSSTLEKPVIKDEA